jgi:hypothetical protein
MTEKINKGGRPAITLTEEQIAQTEALGAVLSIEQIADYFGIGKTTFYAIMERQPEVSERYKRGKAKAIGAVAQGLLQQARDGNTTAAMFYLKTQAGWRETQNIDHTTNGESIQPQVIEIVTPKITD